MDTRYLITFQSIVREGSFSKAAERLNYTQSAITFHVGQLEEELGVPLFEKVGRRMVLSRAGERLVPFVDEALDSMARLQSFDGVLATDTAELSVGVAETQLCYRLGPVFGELHRRAPHSKLRIRSMNCYATRDALIEGSIDLGIFYTEVGGFGSNLTTHPMGEFEVGLFAAPETAERFSDFTTPERYLDVPFLINEPNCIFRQMFEDYLRSRSLRVQHTIELGSIPTIINLVRDGLGVTFLPQFTVLSYLREGTLSEIPTDMKSPKITAVCAHHKNKWLSPAMQEFIHICSSFSSL